MPLTGNPFTNWDKTTNTYLLGSLILVLMLMNIVFAILIHSGYETSKGLEYYSWATYGVAGVAGLMALLLLDTVM